jgi:hypothetical protein
MIIIKKETLHDMSLPQNLGGLKKKVLHSILWDPKASKFWP